MSFDFSTLITDRSQADVQLWQQLKALGWAGMTTEQQAQWSAGMKGAYTPSDLNRVISCVDYLAGVFQDLGYQVPGYTQQAMGWTYGQSFPAAQANLYLANVQSLMATLQSVTYSAELPADMALLNYAEANNLEELLTEINAYLTALQAVFIRPGVAWATSGSPGFYFAN